MKIQLSDHFDYQKLFRFTFPSIIMMIFTSIYSVVDGFFVSNFVGITPFAAINLIIPLTQILGCFGFMFGSGGSALVSMTLGEKKPEKANQIFSMLTYISAAVGVVLALLGIIFLEPISIRLGADEEMLPYCITYGRILLAALPAFMLQNMFQSFFITAQKPTLGLIVTVLAGVTNMVLDALFIAVFHWGVAGAAVATFLSQCVGGLLPLFYFFRRNDSLLRLGKTVFDGKALFHASTNGSSELVTNISMSLVSMLYNLQLMKFAGGNGVAAYGTVMYISFVFVAIFLGYSIGVAPIIGFHYGAGDCGELKNLRKKSFTIVISASLILAVIAFAFARPLAAIFVSADPELLDMTVSAFRYYAISVLFCGTNIFGSAFFTALNDGVVSAVISFMRTFFFQLLTVLILPVFFGLNGIWYSLFLAEILALFVTVFCLVKFKDKYRY